MSLDPAQVFVLCELQPWRSGIKWQRHLGPFSPVCLFQRRLKGTPCWRGRDSSFGRSTRRVSSLSQVLPANLRFNTLFALAVRKPGTRSITGRCRATTPASPSPFSAFHSRLLKSVQIRSATTQLLCRRQYHQALAHVAPEILHVNPASAPLIVACSSAASPAVRLRCPGE